MENWLSLPLCEPFIFFSVSIDPQLLFLASTSICSHLDLASMSVSQHIFPSQSYSLPNSYTQPMHRHECKHTDSKDTQTRTCKTIAILLGGQRPAKPTSSAFKTGKFGQRCQGTQLNSFCFTFQDPGK